MAGPRKKLGLLSGVDRRLAAQALAKVEGMGDVERGRLLELANVTPQEQAAMTRLVIDGLLSGASKATKAQRIAVSTGLYQQDVMEYEDLDYTERRQGWLAIAKLLGLEKSKSMNIKTNHAPVNVRVVIDRFQDEHPAPRLVGSGRATRPKTKVIEAHAAAGPLVGPPTKVDAPPADDAPF